MSRSRLAMIRAQFDGPSQAAAYAACHFQDGPVRRYHFSRIRTVEHLLEDVHGDLLDVGCGPGMFLRHLVDARPYDFRLAGIDQSEAMFAEARDRLKDVEGARLSLGQAESLPFPGSSFDVLLAMGVLEYCDVPATLAEFSRVLRPKGTAIVSMHNPLSPYRLFEWGVYWPLGRALGRVEGWFGRPPEHRHGRDRSGIRALPPGRLRKRLCEAGLDPERLEYYDVTVLVPPFDRRWRPAEEHESPTATPIESGYLRRLGTGYLVVARRTS